MRSALNGRVQLQLLRKLRDQKTLIQKGFTLVELMIVVAIVGILSAVAIPQFLQARSSAELGAQIGEGVGFAKECATKIVSEIGAEPVVPASSNVDMAGTCDGAAAVTFTTGTVSPKVDGVKCLGEVAAQAEKAVITVETDGTLSCVLS